MPVYIICMYYVYMLEINFSKKKHLVIYIPTCINIVDRNINCYETVYRLKSFV